MPHYSECRFSSHRLEGTRCILIVIKGQPINGHSLHIETENLIKSEHMVFEMCEQTDRYTDILLLHHHLSQEGIHTSCIKHSVRIQNDRIYSLNELLMHGTHCLLMLTFPYCSGSNNLLSELIFHSFYSAMLCIRGTSHGPVFVSVRLCPSVTSRSSTITAKHRITQTTPVASGPPLRN